jgi:hypothetical protein
MPVCVVYLFNFFGKVGTAWASASVNALSSTASSSAGVGADSCRTNPFTTKKATANATADTTRPKTRFIGIPQRFVPTAFISPIRGSRLQESSPCSLPSRFAFRSNARGDTTAPRAADRLSEPSRWETEWPVLRMTAVRDGACKRMALFGAVCVAVCTRVILPTCVENANADGDT